MRPLSPEVDRIVFDMIVEAAENGLPGPSNGDIAEAIEASVSAGYKVIERLVERGLIRVTWPRGGRSIEIVATGQNCTYWYPPRDMMRVGGMGEARIDVRGRMRQDREPCPRCGVRRDLGCAHQAASVPEVVA